MTTRLPFTLTPLEGEPFEVWLHAYAARLALPPDHLAAALGLRIPGNRGRVSPPRPPELAAIGAATGLAAEAITAMFTAGRPPPPLVRAWMPQRVTRFCPACLAAGPRQMPADWSLPVNFFCMRHSRVLAATCPDCGRQPSHPPPLPPSRPGRCAGCGGRLDTASPPACADVPAARQAQRAITGMLASVRDPGQSPPARRQALEGLTDLALVAFHLATAGEPESRQGLTPAMLTAGTLTAASALLAGQSRAPARDPLASLAARVTPGITAAAIPHSWAGASPALRTRIARARDQWLPPADRLRHATTLPAARIPGHRPPGHPDIAVTRAARLPGQIWADWAIRLTSDPAIRHDNFRPAALIALLLPHSAMPLRELTALAGGQHRRQFAGYQIKKLGAGRPAALRVLTELALAIDSGDIPIDYQRRRDLAARQPLIGDATWATIARDAGMTTRNAAHARRYLYELLTGCPLGTAPAPCRLAGGKAQASYTEFTTTITTDLAAALRDHARRVLRAGGISGEPLEWQPPASWVTISTWPGSDPAATDPGPIHHALLSGSTPAARVAADLGLSADHLRQILHHHPLPRPRHPLRRTLIPRPAPASPPPGQQPGALYLDPAWLREQYLTRLRTLNDIAAQLGCPVHIVNRFAREHGIPIRPRGGPLPATAPRQLPPGLPEPLRNAFTGRGAPARLRQLLAIAGHPSLHHAARALGVTPSVTYSRIARLERDCGGQLVNRSPRPPGTGTLTPLGQQLSRQAREYLDTQLPPPPR